MGLNSGFVILEKFREGRYNKYPARYNIYVDGGSMKNTGIQVAMERRTEGEYIENFEETIAEESMSRLSEIVDAIEFHLGREPSAIVIFFSGAPVPNKIPQKRSYKFDMSLVKSTFMTYCEENGMRIEELSDGESELRMYLNRDRDANLNVFVTDDTDMMPICYGHTPRIDPEIADVLKCSQDDESDKSPKISDDNSIYKLANGRITGVTDSCLWIRSYKGMTAFGMDNCEERVGLTPSAFRTFAALCGTNFTHSLLVRSTISGILAASEDDKSFVNSLEDINEIAAALLLIGIRAEGKLKKTGNDGTDPFHRNSVPTLVTRYIRYITTGEMSPDPFPRPRMSEVCKEYVYGMKNQTDRRFGETALAKWSRTISPKEAIENLRRYLTNETSRQAA